MNKTKNTYAFEIVKWTDNSYSTIPAGTYFIKCDHFPDSAFIDKFIYDDYKKAKLEHKDTCFIFSKNGFKKFNMSFIKDTTLNGMSKLCWEYSKDNKIITTYIEYQNIRKI